MAWTAPRTWTAGEVITAALLNAHLRDNLLAIGDPGAWTAWTPVLTASGSNPTLGTGSTASGRYKQLGNTVHFAAQVRFGTSGVTVGSGDYRLTLPVAANSSAVTLAVPIGSARVRDDSAALNYVAVPYLGSSTVMILGGHGVADVGAASPFAMATSDYILVTGVYEAA